MPGYEALGVFPGGPKAYRREVQKISRDGLSAHDHGHQYGEERGEHDECVWGAGGASGEGGGLRGVSEE